MMCQFFHYVFYGTDLLADGHIKATNIAAALVDDGIDGQRSFSGLPVADDEFTLPFADGNHGIDGQPAGLQRTLHDVTIDDGGGFMLNGPEF